MKSLLATCSILAASHLAQAETIFSAEKSKSQRDFEIIESMNTEQRALVDELLMQIWSCADKSKPVEPEAPGRRLRSSRPCERTCAFG